MKTLVVTKGIKNHAKQRKIAVANQYKQNSQQTNNRTCFSGEIQIIAYMIIKLGIFIKNKLRISKIVKMLGYVHRANGVLTRSQTLVRTIPFSIRNLTTNVKKVPCDKEAKPKVELAPALEYWERLEICKECPKGSHPIQGYPTKCEECGCLIQAKAMFPIFHCPIGKW